MLGYDVHFHKWMAVIMSGTMAALSGAAYALLFGYAGATFASVQYSIFPLLWVLFVSRNGIRAIHRHIVYVLSD